MRISGIYKIQSKVKPERIYIGSSINIKNRWKEHRVWLNANKHHSQKLQKHYNKYGKDDLIYSIITGCERFEIVELEQFFIDSFNPYFNVCKKAYSCFGVKRSEESRKRISLSKMGNKSSVGRIVSEETRIKLSMAKKGKSTWRKGKPLTKEHRHKISESMLGEKNHQYGKTSPRKGKLGTPSPYKGKKGRYSEETLEKMRKSNKQAWVNRKQKHIA